MNKKESFLPYFLLRNFSIVGLWTMASKILGFARDILMANFLGSGPIAEAFLIAFSLPNMFRRLFAEGAFNSAFIPILSKKLSKIRNAETFSSDALSILLALLLMICALAEIFMPSFIIAMASGFTGDSRLQMSVDFGRIMFPYILLISLSAFFGGILNALNKYSVTAAAPLLLNIAFILALLVAESRQLSYGWALTFAVPVAGLLQLCLMLFFLKHQKFKIRLKFPKFTGDIKRLAVVAVPAALAGGVIQVNLLVGRQVASYFDGAIAWLSYADRLYQLPLGVIGIAIGVVLLPNLSKVTSRKKEIERNNLVNRSTEFALIFTLPATSALLIIPYPLIVALFERGAFTSYDAYNTSNALLVYAIGLPAFVFQKIFSTIYFAYEDTQSPFRFALIGMVCNLVLAIGLASTFGYLAPAIGTSVSGWIITFFLWRNLHTFNFRFDANFYKMVIKILGATVVLSLFLILSKFLFITYFLASSQKIILIVFLIIISSVIYFIACKALNLLEPFSQIYKNKNEPS